MSGKRKLTDRTAKKQMVSARLMLIRCFWMKLKLVPQHLHNIRVRLHITNLKSYSSLGFCFWALIFHWMSSGEPTLFITQS